MRVNLFAKSTRPLSSSGNATIPLSITIKPSCGVPGDYEYATDSATVLRMLRQNTDLNAFVLERFHGDLHRSPSVRLLGVDLKDDALEQVGYFID